MYREQKGLICLYKFVVDVIVCCRILSFVRHLAGRCFRTRYLCSTIEPLAEKGLSRRERSQIRRRTNLSRPCNFFPSRLFFFFFLLIFTYASETLGEKRVILLIELLPRRASDSTKLRPSLAKVERLIFDMLDFIDFPRDSDRHFRPNRSLARYIRHK